MLAGAAALGVAFPLLHSGVTAACDAGVDRLGFVGFNQVALLALGVLSALGCGVILWRARGRRLAALALGGLCVAAWQWLLVANVEIVHLPQFALLAALLARAGLAAPRAWVAATAAGWVDEVYQHLVLYAGRADTYMDYNDVFFDALGAAWGVLLVAGRWPRWLAPGLVVAGAAAMALDPPVWEPLLTEAVTGKWYRRLSAGEGLVLIGGVAGLLGTDRR